ncbi:oxidoreductase [Aquiflexum gelatinilyticum]|uniref:Oxidoreductase n=1 Tax=Aquiflexum gelatinilyticum TaxID=2961943 RepID=A0A9X2P5P4_9BACT|nr:oxidoreductase [Aquiflexum gelatinilyticum]MCR9014022.1 oxidoreductase [Aquiflexum gelatinilyticum]
MKKIAFLAGTSGLIGMQLLHQLLQDNSYDYLISVGRRKLALKHHKLVQVEGDFSKIQSWDIESKLREEDLGGLFFPIVDAINKKSCEMHAFCSLGTTIKVAGSKDKFYEIDHDYVIGFAKWTYGLGANKFLYVSAMGANPQSSVFYNKVKGEVEEDLKVIPFDYLGLFQPSLLVGNRKEFRFGEEVAKILTKPLVWLKIGKSFRPINDNQVSKAMIHHANQTKPVKVEVISSKKMQDF